MWRADIRWRGMALAVLAVLPWGLFAIGRATTPEVWLTCSASSLLFFLLLYWELRDPARAHEVLARCSGSDPEDTLLEQASALVARLEALEHRWVRRHAITGLPIRESLLEQISRSLDTGRTTPMIGAVRFGDYRRLATFDPDAAESALRMFAERIRESLRADRTLAHVDRDCFAILFADVPSEAARAEFAVLCYALGAEIELEGLSFEPEVEAGMALAPDEGDTAAALLNHALLSMTRLGRSPDALPAPAAPDIARERFTIQQGLRLAIDRRELELNFQPVVDVSQGLLIGAEALLRWRQPDLGLISPARFIPVLEDSDLTDEIGMWVLNGACREARRWRDDGLGDLHVAVNFSARQLRGAGLVQMVERTVRRHGLDPDALEIELTETAAAKDADMTRRLLGDLRDLGVSIAIDDFGSGYSSLSYLKNLPFDKLKIDREFVRDVHLRHDSQAICRSLIELGRGLRIKVLAEGAEQLEEVETLERLGCSIFQGFYFSRPLTAEDFMHFAVHRPPSVGAKDARHRQAELARRIGQ